MADNLLSERQQIVLRLVVQEYIQTALPVSSKTITAEYPVGVSSATIRNEMAALEDKGYLMQPHTSAGRVPTELGYRYFVEKLMEKADLPLEEQRMISHQFHQSRLELDQWLRLSAAVLARTSHNASLVTAPKSERCYLKHVELISLRDNLVLLILVLQGGTLKQQILELDNPVDQDELGPIAQQLTGLWAGLNAPEIAATTTALTGLAATVSEVAVDTMRRIDARRSSDIYHDGLLNSLNQPEFRHREGVQQVIRALEERQLVEQLVGEALQHGGVQIIIGGEGKWEELSEVGIVLARYGIDDTVAGAMGVLGPVRMAYGRAVSVVRYMSHLMSDLISDLYGYKSQ
ncbi:MAG: heat-inducible transcriptional repressor HrcA [Anaerolineae bacterium]|nr:heat-inducible transcriptional repressor HrcA [Anaerolineae bacterium]